MRAVYFTQENEMIRTILSTLTLAIVALVTTTSDATAQGRRGYYGGVGVYNNGYYGGNYGNGYRYGNYGYRNGSFNAGRYYGYNNFNGFSTPNTYSYATPGYYYSTPQYYSAPNTGVVTTSGYLTTEANNNNSATLNVVVPEDNAEIWIGNSSTTSRGMMRQYVTPTLEAGKDYAYTLRARWTVDGRAFDQTREVKVRAGQTSQVDFREPQPELIK
jgi:uncharacterized protein (TIGR03000 family)